MFPVYASVELVAVLPFPGHGFHGRWGVIHDMVLEEAGEALILPLPKKPGFFTPARNPRPLARARVPATRRASLL